jgi:hypothetical protein
MICAVHQPNFIPYLGFFAKFARCDVFVLYDTAQYSKGDFHNRNRIKTTSRASWLTVPVPVWSGQPIREVVTTGPDFARRHLRSLAIHSRRARHFEAVFAGIERAFRGGRLAVPVRPEPSAALVLVRARGNTRRRSCSRASWGSTRGGGARRWSRSSRRWGLGPLKRAGGAMVPRRAPLRRVRAEGGLAGLPSPGIRAALGRVRAEPVDPGRGPECRAGRPGGPGAFAGRATRRS